jgi:hypothetical protein
MDPLVTTPSHGSYFQSSIGHYPGTAAIILAVLVVLVLILSFTLSHYKSKCKGGFAACGRGWDPAASAEAEALATVGSLQHESYGEKKLQGAINAAYDSNVGLSDDQLASLMLHGGAP